MAKKVLIPLDGSTLGETALRYVEELMVTLSAEDKMEVTLFQVLPRSTQKAYSGGASAVAMPLSDAEMEPSKEKAMEYLNQAGESLRSKGVKVECKVIIGELAVSSAEEIIRAADDLNADLMAMSTHGRRGLSRWVFGSVTEKVLRAGKTPILVVRAGDERLRAVFPFHGLSAIGDLQFPHFRPQGIGQHPEEFRRAAGSLNPLPCRFSPEPEPDWQAAPPVSPGS